MTRFSGVIPAALLALLLFQAGPALAKPKPSTPEERAQAVQMDRDLEANPMAGDAAEKRAWLIRFYERVPDITVTMCDLLGPLPKENHPYFPEVLAQSMFSQGTFIIEHPDQAKETVAVQTAGMIGALKVYEAFANAKPEGRLPFLDEMLKRRDEGTLAAYMADAVPKGCK